MQALCGLQGIFDLFNCKTPESAPCMPMTAASSWQSENRRTDRSCDLFVISAGWAFFFRKNVVYLLPDDSVTEEGDTP